MRQSLDIMGPTGTESETGGRRRSKLRTKKSVQIEPGEQVFGSELTMEMALLGFGKKPTLGRLESDRRDAMMEAMSKVSEEKSFATSEGLNLPQATLVYFLCHMGVGTGLAGFYASYTGWMGYIIALAIVCPTVVMADNAMMNTARSTGAVTFSDLSVNLPKFLQTITTYASIIWCISATGVMTMLMYNAVNQQVFANMGVGHWPFGRAVPGHGRFRCYLIVIAILTFVSLPCSFSGTLAKVMNATNLVATVGTLFLSTVKGLLIYLYSPPTPDDPHDVFPITDYKGIVKGICLLAAMMMYTGFLPQLSSQIGPDVQDRASTVVPRSGMMIVGFCYSVVGVSAYLALGTSINGDMFKQYTLQYPDVLCTLIQIGVIVLMGLGVPLTLLPPKSQLWAMYSQVKGISVPLDAAPAWARIGLTIFCAGVGGLLPAILGEEVFMTCFSILCGTVGNYINIGLTGIIIIYEGVLPKRRNGEPWLLTALSAAWIFVIVSLSVAYAFVDIVDIFIEKPPLPPSPINNYDSPDWPGSPSVPAPGPP